MSNAEFSSWYRHESKRKPEEVLKGTRKMFLGAVWNAWKLGYAFGKGADKNETIGEMP